MIPLETFYTDDPRWYEKIGDIHALLERVKISVDCRPFIGFMLDAIGNSLYKYVDVATETMITAPGDVGANVGVSDKILELLAQQPHLSARELAALLNKATRTVERHLKTLREQGRLKRVGSDKAGHWVVIEKPQ